MSKVMSIGPVFVCSNDFVDGLEDSFAHNGVRVTRVDADRILFRKGLAGIVAFRADREENMILWLTFPKAHAFLPVFWPFDFALSRSIEAVLTSSGAARTDWGAYADAAGLESN